MQFLFVLGGGAFVLYLSACGLLYAIQDRMIFVSSGEPAVGKRYDSWAVRFEVEDAALTGWWVPGPIGPDKPLVIYHGGSGEDVSLTIDYREQLGASSLLLMNYRGSGGSSGRSSEAILFSDALAVFDWVVNEHGVDPEHIIVAGRSLGTGVAVYVARHRPVRAVVLSTPYDSFVSIARSLYPWVPVDWLLAHRFESIRHAAEIDRPALFLVAGQDQVIPKWSSMRLADAWAGPTEVVVIDASDHQSIHLFDEYWARIHGFINAAYASGVSKEARNEVSAE